VTRRVIDDTSLDKDLYVFDEFGRCALRGVGALLEQISLELPGHAKRAL
jgi:hypothetical protein